MILDLFFASARAEDHVFRQSQTPPSLSFSPSLSLSLTRACIVRAELFFTTRVSRFFSLIAHFEKCARNCRLSLPFYLPSLQLRAIFARILLSPLFLFLFFM